MLAAHQFSQGLDTAGLLPQVSRVIAEMFGSLGATGKGHGTPKAVLMGLEGELPESVDVVSIIDRVAAITRTFSYTVARLYLSMPMG